jgi:hypothetical protein
MIIANTEQITEMNGTAYTDLYISDLEVHVTAAGSGWTDLWDDWAPSYFDGTNSIDVTNNTQLLDMYLVGDNWYGGESDRVMLAGTSGDTSGDIVEADCYEQTGGHYTCDRTTTVVGSWSFDASSGISLDLPKETETLSVVANGSSSTGYFVQSVGMDKVGSVWNDSMLTGSDATAAIVQQMISH